MKYAIVKTGSTQLKISEGDTIKILGNIKKPAFEVLFYTDGKTYVMDKEALKDVKVTSKVLDFARGRKVHVGRFKSKSRYDKTRGFREQ